MTPELLLTLTFFIGSCVFISLPILASYAFTKKALKPNGNHQKTFKQWAIELDIPIPQYVSFRFNLIVFSAFVIICCLIIIVKAEEYFYIAPIILQVIYTIIGIRIGHYISAIHKETLKHIE